MKGFFQDSLENFYLGAARALDSKTVLKICCKSSSVYFGTEKIARSSSWLKDYVKGASRTKSLGEVGDSLSSSYLLNIREIAQKQIETDGATEARFLRECP